jgi:hypothetical protein
MVKSAISISSWRPGPMEPPVSFGWRFSLRSVEPFSFDYFLDLYRPWTSIFSDGLDNRKEKGANHLYTLRIVDSLILVKPSAWTLAERTFSFCTGFWIVTRFATGFI